MSEQQRLAIDPAADVRRLRRELDRTYAAYVQVQDELALYTGDTDRLEAMAAERFNDLQRRTLQMVSDECRRVEAVNGACWELLHEWERLGRGDGTHGAQLRAALQSQDVREDERHD